MKNTVPGFPETIDIAKSQARRLATALSGRCVVTHGQALEVVASLHGERTWGAMIARFSKTSTSQGSYDLGLPPIQTSEQTPARTMGGWRTHELRRLADVLRTSSRCSASYRDRVLARIVGDGCVAVSQLDELLDTVSSELGGFCFALTGDRVVELFGIETQSFLSRPGEGDVRTTGARCIALAGAAYLLAILEDLGFETRPEILVDVVNRTAAGRAMLTRHEIDCLWYLAEREEGVGRRLFAKGHLPTWERPDAVFSTPTGRRCSVHATRDGDVIGIAIDPTGS